jgi:glycyl-tRNA synthetase alpha subunit
MATTPKPGAPEIGWDVAVERYNATDCTYWITVRNLTNSDVTFEGRFAVLS